MYRMSCSLCFTCILLLCSDVTFITHTEAVVIPIHDRPFPPKSTPLKQARKPLNNQNSKQTHKYILDNSSLSRFAQMINNIVRRLNKVRYEQQRLVLTGSRHVPAFGGQRGAPMFIGKISASFSHVQSKTPMLNGKTILRPRTANMLIDENSALSFVGKSLSQMPKKELRLLNTIVSKTDHKGFPEGSSSIPVSHTISKRFVIPRFPGSEGTFGYFLRAFAGLEVQKNLREAEDKSVFKALMFVGR